MAVLVRFPKVAPSVEEAMVGAWRKTEGDRVEKGEALVELVTDKATFDFEAEDAGVLLCVLAPPKSTIPVNYVIAILGAPGEPVPDVSEENRQLLAAHQEEARGAKWAGPKRAGASRSGAVRATPSARRLARKSGVDLTDVAVGVAGVVKEDHVRSFIEARSRSKE